MIATTLNDILKHDPCNQGGDPEDGGWAQLTAYLGKSEPDDEPLPLSTILESNGIDDAMWAMCCLGPEHESWIRLMVCDMVEPALKYTDDERAHNAVRVTRQYARGECSEDELSAASCAAWDAWTAAWATRAAWAARAAARAASCAGWAGAAAGVAACDAAWANTQGGAWDAARKEQKAIFIQYVTR